MIYTLKRDDIPLLSQWIKKFDLSKQVEFFGEADDAMSELFAIFSISSVVGISIGLSSKVRNTLM